jgi:hypothetical protein
VIGANPSVSVPFSSIGVTMGALFGSAGWWYAHYFSLWGHDCPWNHIFFWWRKRPSIRYVHRKWGEPHFWDPYWGSFPNFGLTFGGAYTPSSYSQPSLGPTLGGSNNVTGSAVQGGPQGPAVTSSNSITSLLFLAT